MKGLLVVEVVTGLCGFTLLWLGTNGYVAWGALLLLWSNNVGRAYRETQREGHGNG